MRMLKRAKTAATLTVFCLAVPVHAQSSASVIPDVVYGHKDGMALTFDVFTPPGEPNGVGILNMVSSGWVSRWTPPDQARARFEALLDQGFTVFAVRHGSSPRFNVPEAYADVWNRPGPPGRLRRQCPRPSLPHAGSGRRRR